MLTKHFLKTLIVFTGMILFGLVGIFLVSHFDQSEEKSTAEISTCENGKIC